MTEDFGSVPTNPAEETPKPEGEQGPKTIEVGRVTLELGPELGEMSWKEIDKLFGDLIESGDRDSRLLSKEEFERIGGPIREIWDDNSLSADQKIEKAKEMVKSLGFTWLRSYWSGTYDSGTFRLAWIWNAGHGYLSHALTDGENKCFVRLVRKK